MSMNINDLMSKLSPQQVKDILVSNGIESKSGIYNVENLGGNKYSYDVYNVILQNTIHREIKIELKQSISVEVLKNEHC